MSHRLDVDVQVRRGQFRLAARFAAPLNGVTVVFGPSGAGKSMLLMALAGLLRLEGGGIVMGDQTLDDVATGVRTPPHLRGVGVVFQGARLFPHLSVRGNLEYAARRASTSASRLSMADALGHFDLRPLLDRSVRDLSGGEKNRVALARALLSGPDLLLLDEPFAALDGARRAAYLATLRQLNETLGLPMIVVTHQIDDAVSVADHLVALQNGEVAVVGPTHEATAAPQFQAILDLRDAGAAVAATGFSRKGGESADSPNAGGIWLRADHVLIASERPRGLSARNVWEGRVESIVTEASGASLIRIRTTSGLLLSRVTPQAVGDLGLKSGASVWAIVKAHAVG